MGDFDSIREDSRKFAEDMNIRTYYAPNDFYTDSEKSLIFFEDEIIPTITNKSIKVIMLGAFGGRMDHTLYNLHLLWKKALQSPLNYDFFMMNNENLLTVVQKGNTTIKPSAKITKKVGCGLITMGNCSYIRTRGLAYEMGPDQVVSSMAFGNVISTSNEIANDTIEIESSDPLIWVTPIHYRNLQ